MGSHSTAGKSGLTAKFDRSAKRRLSSRFLFKSLLGAAVLAGLIEVVLRFGLGLGNPVLVVPDPACGYVVKPNQHLFRLFNRIDINQFGMRSAELPPTRSPNTLRVMFVGDSITYGTSRVDQSRIFTELLHRELPSIVKRPVEVLNASSSGWAIENELAYVQSRGIFDSDTVILVLNSEDLGQRPATFAQYVRAMPAEYASSAFGELYLHFIWPRLHPLGPPPDRRGEVRKENLANLDGLRELVVRQHARLAVVYVPFAKDIHAFSASSAAALRTWTLTRQVPFFDLTDAESPFSPSDITIGDGTHLNNKGNRIVANAIEHSWTTQMRTQ